MTTPIHKSLIDEQIAEIERSLTISAPACRANFPWQRCRRSW